MILYTNEEKDRIQKIKETNDRLEDFFKDKRIEWKNLVEPLFDVIKIEFNSSSSKKIMEAQSMCLSFRQLISDQISTFLDKRSRQDVKLKRIKQDKFIWYSTSFGIKTNLGEKTLLIEAHVSEEQRNIEIIENHIEFLRQTNKTLENFQYTIKNIIELLNYLS